ncbi:MAG: hypothetical protein EPO06_05595 [Burkholderiaceae bacterium]|nr:MAG: hypothetical protein EPO06_05595 [Burkholderiaceae bacterium]
MLPPSHTNKSPEEIIGQNSQFNSVGYLYRAVSWLDYFERMDQFPALLYACIEGRFGIEYLLFEELVIGTGANLSRQDYEKCLEERTKLKKAIDRLIPDYEKLQQFTSALIAVEPQAPKLIYWKPKDLMKSWGKLSEYLHWLGVRGETTEVASWRTTAYIDVRQTLLPIWEKITSGQSGFMHPDNMNAEIREVWLAFKGGKTDLEGAKIRMNILKPHLIKKYEKQHHKSGR